MRPRPWSSPRSATRASPRSAPGPGHARRPARRQAAQRCGEGPIRPSARASDEDHGPAGGGYFRRLAAGREARAERTRPDLDRSVVGVQGQRRQLLQLPPDLQGRAVLRHDRSEPATTTAATGRHRPRRADGAAVDHRVHLDQDLEREELQRLLDDAAASATRGCSTRRRWPT